MTKKIGIGVLFVLVVFGLWYFQHAKNTSSKTDSIKIGAILPLSGGGLTPYGESARNAILLAIENSGEKDRVQLVIEDDKGCQSKEAVSSTQKLIDVDHVQIIIGAMCTSPTLAFAPITEAKKIVVLTSASGKSITGAGEYIFRTYASDADKNVALAKYIYSKGYRKAAFIHDSSQDASASQRDDTKEEFIKLGGLVVADEAFLSKDKDLRTQLNKIKSSGADIVFIGGLPDGLVLLLKQIKELGITSTIASTESSIDTSLLSLAGQSAEGLIIPAGIPSTNTEVADFIVKYKAKYNTEPKQFSAEAYDATLLAINAGLTSDGSGPSIKSQLEKIGQKYQGASGEISFDKNGDVKKPIVMKKVSGGKLVNAE